MHSEQWPPYSPGRSTPGYSRPEYVEPEYVQPEYVQPGYSRPNFAGPDRNDPDDTLLYPQPGYQRQDHRQPAHPRCPEPEYSDLGYPRNDYDQGYHRPVYSEAAIAVTPRYFPLAFLLQLVKPVLIVDGQPVRMNWRNPAVVPVSPGQHHVHVYTPYLIPRRMGKADLVVTAQPGQTVELEYRSPLVVFARGALGSPPQGYPGMAAFIILMIISLVLVICGAASAFRQIGETAARQAAGQTTGEPAAGRTAIPKLPPLSTDGPGLPTSDPEQASPTEAAGRPALRPGVPARRVTGATFAAGDRTGTKAFAGWPFAFRTPQGWDCRRQDDKRVPDAKLYGCSDAQSAGGEGVVVVMLRPCAAPCGTALMNQMHSFWFSPTDEIRRAGATTNFAENAKGATTGGYELYMSHFFAAGGRTGTPDWQVAVAAVAKSKAGRPDAQKVLNDILSQTS
ncbi:hypothetical protein QLQ12_06030 [Actinoplanes sp. NEAU-A12]|uniref:Uncharacterized protein n=1 Tax=Actinoplanes sandaracinus TaxID=3045177 RepID=A0ABT6WEK0_9ACTN|nr:hypothetical protein [Actinoplanes sandaracinus]MDI6098160.1 hypothetical protein [Actinoplanes sandaracinus]